MALSVTWQRSGLHGARTRGVPRRTHPVLPIRQLSVPPQTMQHVTASAQGFGPGEMATARRRLESLTGPTKGEVARDHLFFFLQVLLCVALITFWVLYLYFGDILYISCGRSWVNVGKFLLGRYPG